MHPRPRVLVCLAERVPLSSVETQLRADMKLRSCVHKSSCALGPKQVCQLQWLSLADPPILFSSTETGTACALN